MAWYIFVTFTSGDGFGQGRMNCLNVKHWMGTAQQGREEQVSVDTMAAGACGSYSPALTLELDEPVVKRGSEVTYRSVMTSATCGDPVQEFALFVTSGRRSQQKGACDGQEEQE